MRVKIFIKLASDADFNAAVTLLNMKQKNKYRNNLYFKSIDAKLRAVASLNDAGISFNNLTPKKISGATGGTSGEKQAIAISITYDTARTRNKNHSNPSHLAKVSDVRATARGALTGQYKNIYKNTRTDFTAIKFMMLRKSDVVSAVATLKTALTGFEGVEVVYNRDNKSVIARVFF